MPEISPVFVMPAAPAAPSATSAAATGAHATADGGPADFLSQFKAAIRNLASVALPGVAATPVLGALVAQPSASQPVGASDAPPTDAKNADVKQSDLMPEILATLGFVVVPPQLQPPVAAAQPQAAETGSETIAVGVAASPTAAQQMPQAAPPPLQVPQAPQVSQSLPDVQSLPAQALVPPAEAPQSPQSPQTSQSPQTQKPSSPTESVVASTTPPLDQMQAIPAQALDIPQPQQQLTAVAQSSVSEQHAPTATPKTDTPPATAPLTPVDSSGRTDAPQITVAQAVSTPLHEAASAPVADAAPPIVATQPAGSFQQSGFDSDSRQPHSSAQLDSVLSTPPAQAAPDATFAAAATMATQTSAPLPADIQPAQVVNQIVHQADLYRQPGDRSVRIQLHPEGLGGVDVTLRYSAASGIQLHLNVEHAATGALVQAGWTELRDALATQGIHADRLVMSLTAPAKGGGLDFSNGTGSSRSDSGLASFTQGQTSQQRQETQDQRAPRGWSNAIDPILPSSVDANARVAPASAGRIDYRV